MKDELVSRAGGGVMGAACIDSYLSGHDIGRRCEGLECGEVRDGVSSMGRWGCDGSQHALIHVHAYMIFWEEM